MRLPVLRAFTLSVLLLSACLLMSCSGYADKVAELRGELASGQPAAALSSLEKAYDDGGDDPGLPYLFERGTLLYLNGDYAGCQTAFATAETVVDDLYTRSLSREAARLIFNDTAQAYRGELFERVWVHYYRALAFLADGQRSGAAVEGRAAVEDLQRMADTGSDEAKYRNDPFLQYFSGLLYEMDGELNDAWINYVAAERLYQAVDIYGVNAPEGLARDLIRAGERLGFREEAAVYRERYPEAAKVPVAEGLTEVLLLVDTGIVPGKISQRMDFPIFEGGDEDEDAAWTTAALAYDNWHYRESRNLELDYILSIALPAVDVGRDAPRLSWSTGERSGRLETAADLGALSRQCLEDRYGSVMIRTVARALLKYWAKEKVEEKHGKGWGLVTDILGSVTEVADTRSWSTLPEHVHMARLFLPPGEHRVNIQGGGLIGEGLVTAEAGRLNFVALRLY